MAHCLRITLLIPDCATLRVLDCGDFRRRYWCADCTSNEKCGRVRARQLPSLLSRHARFVLFLLYLRYLLSEHYIRPMVFESLVSSPSVWASSRMRHGATGSFRIPFPLCSLSGSQKQSGRAGSDFVNRTWWLWARRPASRPRLRVSSRRPSCCSACLLWAPARAASAVAHCRDARKSVVSLRHDLGRTS